MTKLPDQVLENARAHLAPSGIVRAAINMANSLLVSGTSAQGEPEGVAPDMAREIARCLGATISFVPFAKADAIADMADQNAWDIAMIGADPARAGKIFFTGPYCEIEASYLVPENSPATGVDDIDRPGSRIAVQAGAAFELWLSRNIAHADLRRSDSFENVRQAFINDKLDALAELRPRLLSIVKHLPGTRVLNGKFMSVQQAIGTLRGNADAEAFLENFLSESRISRLADRFIALHGVAGLLPVH